VAVERNSRTQGDLFDGFGDSGEAACDPVDTSSVDAPVTWFLMRHRDGDVVRIELSLPESFQNNYIETWKERIILEPLRLDPEPTGTRRDEGGGDGGADAIVIDIVRRA
jgi:hypothetical protein